MCTWNVVVARMLCYVKIQSNRTEYMWNRREVKNTGHTTTKTNKQNTKKKKEIKEKKFVEHFVWNWNFI